MGGEEETARDFLRVKAVLDVAGSDRKYVIQCVHMMRTTGFVDSWSEGDIHENRIIFIGRGMQERREVLQEGFKSCIAKPLRFEPGSEVLVKVSCEDHHHHSHEGHAAHNSPQVSSKLVVTMQPGKIGCTILTSGLVESVREGSPAALAGVPVGWEIVAIDDMPFSFEVLDEKVFGDVAYSLTLTPATKREQWEHGCILKQWDECNAYKVKLATGAEALVPLDDESCITAP